MEHLRALGVLKCNHWWQDVRGGKTKKSTMVQCKWCEEIGWRINNADG